jgi:hypothetical protein
MSCLWRVAWNCLHSVDDREVMTISMITKTTWLAVSMVMAVVIASSMPGGEEDDGADEHEGDPHRDNDQQNPNPTLHSRNHAPVAATYSR